MQEGVRQGAPGPGACGYGQEVRLKVRAGASPCSSQGFRCALRDQTILSASGTPPV